MFLSWSSCSFRALSLCWVESCSSSSLRRSSVFLKRLVLTESVSLWIYPLNSSSSFNFEMRVSFSRSNRSNSSRSLLFKSLSNLRSSCRFLLTTFLRLATSFSFSLRSSESASYSRILAAISLFSCVAFSSSDKTMFNRFIRLIFSPSKTCS